MTFTIQDDTMAIFECWTVFFLMIVLASIGILCIETLPMMRVKMPHIEEETVETPEGHANSADHDVAVAVGVVGLNSSTWGGGGVYNVTHNATERVPTDSEVMMETNPKIKLLFTTEPHRFLENFDSFCTVFFTLDFIVRLIVAPDRIKFWKSIMNIIDVLCVLPMWIKYVMLIYDVRIDMELLPVFFLIMMLRVLRICRVLRMARHYTGVKILVLALTASLQELTMLLIFVFIVMLIFSVTIYYAEFFVPDTFPSIPQGYWWSIITLTTVGYGDMSPKSPVGYIVGSMCALTGILATGLPVPIIANNFNLYYSHTKLLEEINKRQPTESGSEVSGTKKPAMDNNKASCITQYQEAVISQEASV